MSYSFQIKAATKAEAKEAVAAKFDEVVASQSIHARDRAAVLANANTVIDLLDTNEAKDVSVSCNGCLSWTGGADQPDVFTSASVACSANHMNRE